MQCDERNRTAPLLGAFTPYGVDFALGSRILLHIHLRRSSGISPGRRSRISPELQLIAYCRVFPPRGRRFPRYPRAFDCCIDGGVIGGGWNGLILAAAGGNSLHKKCNKLQSGADSFSLRGRLRRVQKGAVGDSSTTYEGDTAVVGLPATGGGQHPRRDDQCT